MTLHLLSSVVRFNDDIEVGVSATVTRSIGSDADTGRGWVVEDLCAVADYGPIPLTPGEKRWFTDAFVELANRA